MAEDLAARPVVDDDIFILNLYSLVTRINQSEVELKIANTTCAIFKFSHLYRTCGKQTARLKQSETLTDETISQEFQPATFWEVLDSIVLSIKVYSVF